MGDLRHFLDVGDDATGIGDAFHEHRPRALVDRRLEAVGILGVGPVGVPVEFGEALAELVDRAAIKLAGGGDIVARAHQGVQREQLRRMARRAGQRRPAAFQGRHAFLQHRSGGIHDARIDVAEDLQVEQGRGVIGIFKDEGRRLIDRRGARAGGGIGLGARMHGQRVESIIGHGRLPIADVRS
jgi:hypothetical protein